MRILLDESLPIKLKAAFSSGHEVFTVRDMGWLGKKNGELLALMSAEDFEVFVTPDKNLRYQQSLEKYSIRIAVMDATDNTLDTLQALVPTLETLVAGSTSGKVTIVK